MTKLIRWSDDDNAYIIRVPALAGCMADGQTIEEALHNADIIIEEWIETAKRHNRPIPTPKGRLQFA